MAKIGVFPAAGKLGTSIYTHLLRFVDPNKVILICRSPEKIPAEHTQAGILTRKADYDKPESLDSAFNDISYLLLVSYPSLELEHRVHAHRLAIDAAIASGVSHIFYTSLAFGGDCTPNSVAYVMQAHLQTEASLKSMAESKPGFSFTAIREGIYSESFPMYTGFPDLRNPTDTVRIPLAGAGAGVAWAKIDDLGEATARLVETVSRGSKIEEFKDKIVLLSGPKVYSISDTLDVLGSIVGKTVALEEASIDEYADDINVQNNLGSHGHGDVPRKWATSLDAVKRGETAVTSNLLEELLGRRPESFEETVKKMIG